MRFKFKEYFFICFFTRKGFGFEILKAPNMPTDGITSRCKDLKHILFLDYDNIERWLVEEELAVIQKRFKLSPFYLFISEERVSNVSDNPVGNYHAICLSKMSLSKVIEIQEQCHIDFNYRRAFKISRYRAWVLRCCSKGIKPKPEFLKIVGEKKNLYNEVSEAHLKLIKFIYPEVPIINYKKLDGENRTFVTHYKTGSLGEVRA